MSGPGGQWEERRVWSIGTHSQTDTCHAVSRSVTRSKYDNQAQSDIISGIFKRGESSQFNIKILFIILSFIIRPRLNPRISPWVQSAQASERENKQWVYDDGDSTHSLHAPARLLTIVCYDWLSPRCFDCPTLSFISERIETWELTRQQRHKPEWPGVISIKHLSSSDILYFGITSQSK